MKAHESIVNTVDFTPMHTGLMLSGADDNKVMIWGIENFEKVEILNSSDKV